MKIALVYDRINTWGGAERVLLELHTIWPDAPLFTAVYDQKRALWAKGFAVHPSFLQHIPFARFRHEMYPWLTPMAFESFSFDSYDAVISITSAEAKGIITKPGTTHICYCLTPTRYLWSGYRQYQSNPGWGILDGPARWFHAVLTPELRKVDMVAARRPDYYIAISSVVQKRIRKYYHVDPVSVIHPPVDTGVFVPSSEEVSRHAPFLAVSRLVGHKRIDLVIEACNELHVPLTVVGDGVQKHQLKRMAGPEVQFVDKLTDSQLIGYYQKCRALIHAADEDFGIVGLEALACGKPVIAYGKSGIADVVIDGKTGVLFGRQTKEALVNALRTFMTTTFSESACRKQAETYRAEVFRTVFQETVERLVQ